MKPRLLDTLPFITPVLGQRRTGLGPKGNNCRRAILVAAASLTIGLSTSLAQSDMPNDIHGWSKVKWGMTEDQVLSAMNGQAKRFPERKERPTVPFLPASPGGGVYSTVGIPAIAIGQGKFAITFWLDTKMSLLRSVNISPVKPAAENREVDKRGRAKVVATDAKPGLGYSYRQAFDDLTAMLTTEHGQPTTAPTSSPDSASVVWELPSTRIELRFYRIEGEEHTTLNYFQREFIEPAQCHPVALKPPAPGIQLGSSQVVSKLTGRVFAITNGGDLKPARLAQVFILRGDAVCCEFLKHHSFIGSEANIEYMRAIRASSLLFEDQSRLECVKELSQHMQRVLDLKARYSDAVSTSETDEEGSFNIVGLNQGKYTVLIFGRAGANAGLWMEEVNIEPGQDQSLKLRSQKMACFDPQGLARF